MQNDMMDLLPTPAMEFKAIYGEMGAIIDLEFIWANTIAQKTVSYSGEALKGKRLLDLYPAAVDKVFYQSFLKTITDNEALEFYVKASEGSPLANKHLKFSTRPTAQGCFALITNVTDLVAERDDARGQLAMMETACRDAVHGIAIGNKDQITVYANPALHKMLGYEPGELFGMQVSDMVSKTDSDARNATAKQILNAEISQYVTDRNYVKKNGEEVLMSVAVSSIHGEDAEEKMALAHFRDVGEERRVQAELREALGSLKMMEAACDDAADGIAITDNASMQNVYVNPALCDLLGYTQEEMLETNLVDLVHPEEKDVRAEQARELHAGEVDNYTTDRRFRTKAGDYIVLSLAVSMTTDASGRSLSLAHFRDVSQERKAKITLQNALEKAEEGTRLKSEFLANMSHEIRTPLNGVIGMAQVLSHSTLSEQQAEHVAIIRDSGANLMRLLNDILDLSKVEAGKVDITPIEIDLRHKMNRVYKLHEPIAREKGIGFNVVVHPGLPSRMKLDPVRLHQCLSNLVSNAVKFTSQGNVTVAIKSEPVGNNHKLTIHVSDTGIGIAAEKLGHIFDSFQQADGSTTRSYGGTGLGLTITRRLAELMGGTLKVVSQEGRGSVFTLTLLAEGEDGMGEHQERLMKEGGSAGFADCKVLIVDDNVINRTVATSFLKPYGFIIEEAVNGINALEMLKEKAYDLVLMDVHMPEMNGVTAVRNLRDVQGINQEVPVIVLTADAMSGDRERYLAQGMDGYVSKPIDDRELISEISTVLTWMQDKKRNLKVDQKTA